MITKKSRHQIKGGCKSITDYCRQTGARREVISRRLKKLGITLEEYIEMNKQEMNNAIAGVISHETKAAILEMKFSFGTVSLTNGLAGIQITTARHVLAKIETSTNVAGVRKIIGESLAAEGHDVFKVNDELEAMAIKSVSAEPTGLVIYKAGRV